MTVGGKEIQAKGLGDFFKFLNRKALNASKKPAKNVVENPTWALDVTANITTAAASRNPKNVMWTLPELNNFYHTGKGLYVGKFV